MKNSKNAGIAFLAASVPFFALGFRQPAFMALGIAFLAIGISMMAKSKAKSNSEK